MRARGESCCSCPCPADFNLFLYFWFRLPYDDRINGMKKSTLIVALDRPSAAEAEIILDKMPEPAGWYKVGLELFTADGPAALALLKAKKKNIFLDLKLHDIPNTVARAVRAAAAHDVSLLSVHALGGRRC